MIIMKKNKAFLKTALTYLASE